MVSDCHRWIRRSTRRGLRPTNRLTSHPMTRRKSRPTNHRTNHRGRCRRFHRSCPYRHQRPRWSRPFHHPRRSSHRCRSCRHHSSRRSIHPRRRYRRRSRRCSAKCHLNENRCSFPRCRRCSRCLTSQTVCCSHPCRWFHWLARPRRPCLRAVIRHYSLLDRHYSRATSRPMNRPTIHPEIRTCLACPRRDRCLRRSTHDSGSGPPWHYPPAYFDCDLHTQRNSPPHHWPT
jgi:hypothetical protein